MSVKNKHLVLKSVADLVAARAVKYHCGFKTAWVQWMNEEEKKGFSFEEVNEYLVTP